MSYPIKSKLEEHFQSKNFVTRFYLRRLIRRWMKGGVYRSGGLRGRVDRRTGNGSEVGVWNSSSELLAVTVGLADGSILGGGCKDGFGKACCNGGVARSASSWLLALSSKSAAQSSSSSSR